MPLFASRLAILTAGALACLTLGAAAQDADFKPLFNGKDLTGWEGAPGSWKVVDGVVVGETTAEAPLKQNEFLIWRGGAVKNFVVRAKVRQKGNNSGIQYRSKELPDVAKYVVGGYQCDIHPQPNYNGMLYDERFRAIVAENGQKVAIAADGKKTVTQREVAPTDPDGWNEYEITASGPNLVHKVNGKVAVEVRDDQEYANRKEGILAFQIHAGPPMKVEIKDVLLKVLPDGDTPGKAAGISNDPARGLKVAKGFQADLIYSVPKETQGSWVSMTVDDKGRLIVSDQYGKLYRVDLKPEVKVEPIEVDLGEAQGLLWAFDSLYVVVNRGQKYPSGLYRVKDADGDDHLDKVEMLRPLQGGGEHGPHAVLLGPDRESLYLIAGNNTRVPDLASSRVPRFWGEDQAVPHLPDGSGFMVDEKAPGGYVCKLDPDGKSWELIAMGFRNPYDMAFNKDGELFTYDSDMEWDMNLPWYRPTRVCLVASGADFGYRNGSGKWPVYYPDSLPPTVNIGPGSPTGVTFGYGARFPARYQDALYICDWSYGKLYAIHLKPEGAAYSGEVEEFIAGTPLPLTDIVVNPVDGAMYFAVGGRKTQSGLYRVTYTGNESTTPTASREDAGSMARAIRHKLETFHGKKDPRAVEVAWPHLGDADRSVRYAARVAIESQDPASWRDRALAEKDPTASINALLAVVRANYRDPAHRQEADPRPDAELAARLYEALGRTAWDSLKEWQKLELVRVYQVASRRIGPPEGALRDALIARFDDKFPARGRELNSELAQLLVAYQAPGVAARVLDLLDKAPTQEEQIDYARDLRSLTNGWTPELRERYLRWFHKAAGYRGGNSFNAFIKNIKKASVDAMTPAEVEALKEVIEFQPAANAAAPVAPRSVVKEWKLDELAPLVENGLKGRDFDRGRDLFAAAQCFVCHRFGNDGGSVGPDLTGLVGRFSAHDLLESIVLPSKTISDQYEAVMIATEDGRVVTGRIINLNGEDLTVMPNMLDPNGLVNIDRRKVEEMKPSPVSMMPEGLLNTLNEQEVLDLMAYLLSRGDREAPYFR